MIEPPKRADIHQLVERDNWLELRDALLNRPEPESADLLLELDK